jgi:hypothetical protein
MAYTVPELEPASVTAGDLVTWSRSFAEFSAADGWVLTYALTSSSALISITASTYQTSQFLVSVAKATTANWTAGTYAVQGYVTNGSSRHLVYSGTIKINPNLAAASSGYDNRTHAKKCLDAIETVLEARASKTIQNWSGLEQSFSLIPTSELLTMRDRYLTEYKSEQAAERVAQGLGNRRNVFVRFTSPR